MPLLHLTTTAGDDTAVELTVTEQGAGRPFLVLHGGAGPQSVAAFAARLAATGDARVLTPTHPGFGGTPRPDALTSVADLARTYAALLDLLDLTDVTVVGNSVGGWVAAELALLGSPRVARIVLVDAVGLVVDGSPVADFFSLTMDEVAELSYADPDGFRVDVAGLPDAAKALMAGNRAALLAYGGTAMADPTLLPRLPAVTTPTLAVWGAHDRIVEPAHGVSWAAAIPGARLVVIEDAGHLPQLETPDRLVAEVTSFARAARPADA